MTENKKAEYKQDISIRLKQINMSKKNLLDQKENFRAKIYYFFANLFLPILASRKFRVIAIIDLSL